MHIALCVVVTVRVGLRRQGHHLGPARFEWPLWAKLKNTWYITEKFGEKTRTRFTAHCPGLHGWAGNRKVQSIRILLKQETVSEPWRNFEANQAQLTALFRYAHFISDNRYLKNMFYRNGFKIYNWSLYNMHLYSTLGRRKHAHRQRTRKIAKKH